VLPYSGLMTVLAVVYLARCLGVALLAMILSTGLGIFFLKMHSDARRAL